MNKATIIMLAASLQPALGYAQNAENSSVLELLTGINGDTIVIVATVILAAVAVLKYQRGVKKDNKKESEGVKEKFEKDFAEVKGEFKEEFKKVRGEFKEVRGEFKADFEKVNNTLTSIREDVARLTGRILGRDEGSLKQDKQRVSPEGTTGAPQGHRQQYGAQQPPGESHNPEER